MTDDSKLDAELEELLSESKERRQELVSQLAEHLCAAFKVKVTELMSEAATQAALSAFENVKRAQRLRVVKEEDDAPGAR